MIDGEYFNYIRVNANEDISSNTNTLLIARPSPSFLETEITVADGLTVPATPIVVGTETYNANEYVQYRIEMGDVSQVAGDWKVCLHSLLPSGENKILGPFTFPLTNC